MQKLQRYLLFRYAYPQSCDIQVMRFIANSLNVRNNNVSPAGGGGYITVLIIYESALILRMCVRTAEFSARMRCALWRLARFSIYHSNVVNHYYDIYSISELAIGGIYQECIGCSFSENTFMLKEGLIWEFLCRKKTS
jgi:hypothetical protein